MTEVILVLCSEAVAVEFNQVSQPPTLSATEALSDQNSDLLQDNELDLSQSQSILTDLNPSRESDKREFSLSDRQAKKKPRNEIFRPSTSNSSSNTFVVGENVSCINDITIVENSENEGIAEERESNDNEHITVVGVNNDNNSVTDLEEGNDNENITEVEGNNDNKSVTDSEESNDNVQEVRDNENITELGEKNQEQCNSASKNLIVVLNEKESNLHDSKPAAEDVPNFSAILDSDLFWIVLSLDPLLYEGDDIENMDFVSDLLSTDPPVDFAESSANLKVNEEVASLSPVSQVGSQYEARDLCSKAKVSRGGAESHCQKGTA